MSTPAPEEMEALEKLVDRHGLFEVVVALAVICSDKAAHISACWQDNKTANVWDRESTKLEALAKRCKL